MLFRNGIALCLIGDENNEYEQLYVVKKMDEVLQAERKKLAETEEKIQQAANTCERYAAQMNKEIKSFICVDYEDRAKLSGLYKQQKKLYELAEKYAGYLDSPYFGRMDFDIPVVEGEEYRTESYYIGKEDISTFQAPNDPKKEQLVVDWRSPLGECFYLRNQKEFVVKGNKLSLALKRAFDISERKLKSYQTEYDATNVSLDGDVVDQFLVTVLKDKRRVNRLTDIIRTIQANQNEIIRKPMETSFIVQGCAGSGKTMILLHRLSTILYNNRGLSTQGIKIITPNRFFDMHINALSHELGLDAIERFSVEEYYSYLIHKFDPKIDAPSQVESEKSLDPDLLRYLYSPEYGESMRERYRQVWMQMVEELSASGFYSFLEKAGFQKLGVQSYSNETYEKLVSVYSSARIIAGEKNKAWKEAVRNAADAEERIRGLENKLDEINGTLPQISEDTKSSLQSSLERNGEILMQLDDQIRELDTLLADLESKADQEEKQNKSCRDQLDEIENNREQLLDCTSVADAHGSIKNVIMERERELISQYRQTQSERKNMTIFRRVRRRELEERMSQLSDQYRNNVKQFLDAQTKDLQTKIGICSDRMTEFRNQIEDRKKSRSNLINRKQEKEREAAALGRAFEQLLNNPYPNFTEVLSPEENAILAPLLYQLNTAVNSLLDHEIRLKAAKDRLIRDRFAAEERGRTAFTDEEMDGLDRCGKIIEQVSFSNLSRNVLFQRLQSAYQQYNQEYSKNNYRHRLYLRLFMCSLYYARGVFSDRFINIDEAQDLSVAEYRLLSNILGSRCIFNLYGDTNQNVYSYKGITQWKDISFITDQVCVLNENYRNTLQITKFCNNEFKTSVYPIGISGKKVEELDLKSAIDRIVSEKKSHKNHRCAILYRYGVQEVCESVKRMLDEREVSWSSMDDSKVCILTVEQAKGLEFDSVVAITDQMTKNEKYIAYTRALDSLMIVRNIREVPQKESSGSDAPVNKIKHEPELKQPVKTAGHPSSTGSTKAISRKYILNENVNSQIKATEQMKPRIEQRQESGKRTQEVTWEKEYRTVDDFLPLIRSRGAQIKDNRLSDGCVWVRENAAITTLMAQTVIKGRKFRYSSKCKLFNGEPGWYF